MARKKRIIRPGFCYHVMLRGNAGQEIFKDEADRSRFCLFIQYASEMHKLNIHGFCLMSNHVHLLIQPLTEDLSSGIHSLAFRYAQYFNRKYQRKGYLYQGRFKAIPVQSGNYLAKLIRYIHLNPVRAGIVKSLDKYIWSSFLAYNEKLSFVWLHQNLVLDFFGNDRDKLCHFTEMSPDEAKNELIDIRKSIRNGAYGDIEFVKAFRCEYTDNKLEQEIFFIKEDISIDEIVEFVCCHMNVSVESLKSDSRESRLVQARVVISALTKKMGAANFTDLGIKINRNPSSLSRLAKKMESDPQISTIIHDLSAKLNQVNKDTSYA